MKYDILSTGIAEKLLDIMLTSKSCKSLKKSLADVRIYRGHPLLVRCVCLAWNLGQFRRPQMLRKPLNGSEPKDMWRAQPWMNGLLDLIQSSLWVCRGQVDLSSLWGFPLEFCILWTWLVVNEPKFHRPKGFKWKRLTASIDLFPPWQMSFSPWGTQVLQPMYLTAIPSSPIFFKMLWVAQDVRHSFSLRFHLMLKMLMKVTLPWPLQRV